RTSCRTADLQVRSCSSGPRASGSPHSHERAGCARSGRIWKKEQLNSCVLSEVCLHLQATRRLPMTDRIEKTVELKAPVARVWKALTDHKAFGTWFRVNLDGPFAPGGVSRGHITYPGYEHLKWEAVVQKIEPERLF